MQKSDVSCLPRARKGEVFLNSRIRFGHAEKNHSKTQSRKYGQNPEQPPPRDTGDVYVSSNYWTECGAGEWGNNKNGHCGTSGLIIPTEKKASVGGGGCYVQRRQVDSHICKYRT